MRVSSVRWKMVGWKSVRTETQGRNLCARVELEARVYYSHCDESLAVWMLVEYFSRYVLDQPG